MSRRFLFFSIALFFMSQLMAQVNFMVGYDLGIRKLEEINRNITRYNAENASISKKMPLMWNMSGLDLGVKYKLDFISLEGHYITRFKVGRSRQNVNDETLKNDVKMNDQSYNFGLTLNLKRFGIGSNYENHSFRFSRKFSDDKKYIEAFDPKLNYNAINLFLDFRFKLSDLIGFHVRPYYQFALNGADNISNSLVASNLKLNAMAEADAATKWNMFGIKFLFSNGRQD
ncbi:MAG: hypothetical protein ACOYOA_00010 [Saprospiraceae bacterium]